MNRLILNHIVRAARVHPTNQWLAPYRWQSTKTVATPPPQQGSNLTAALAGGLTVLIGGFAWYQFSGTRQVVGIAQDGVKKAKELKDTMKDKVGNPTENAAETVKYLRTASAALIPGSAPFLGKVFDQIEQISKEHGDEVKKVFEETYSDVEKLVTHGGLDPKTASEAVAIIQKRVKQIQDLAGDSFNDLITKNPQLKDKISEQYKTLKEVAEKAKDKKPEVQKLLKDTGSELAKIFKDNGVSEKSIKQAQELLKKKAEEATKIGEDLAKDAKKK